MTVTVQRGVVNGLVFRSGEQFLVFLRLAPPKSRNSLVPRSDRRDF